MAVIGGRQAKVRAAVGAAIASAVWCWSLAILGSREHLLMDYDVLPTGPPLWGFVLLPTLWLAFPVLLGLMAFLVLYCEAVRAERFVTPASLWLLAGGLIVVLDGLRAAKLPVPCTFFEPLWLTWVSGMAAAKCRVGASCDVLRVARDTKWSWLAVIVMTALALAWWTYGGLWAYHSYQLGYHDFGHFARRIANTWAGRGLLLESPELPRFWDHFNPGLLLFVPLWAVWQDARLFVLLQAVCLAAGGPLVYLTAKKHTGDRWAATGWTAAYLLYPGLSTLNLSHSLGWHPVSVALPLMWGALAALACRRPMTAAALAALACSMEECVIVVLACLSLTMAAVAWWRRRRNGDEWLADRMTAMAWAATGAVLVGCFWLVYELSGIASFQSKRFRLLGGTEWEVLMSPVLRPRAFWGELGDVRSACFVLALLLPLGAGAVRRGWMVLVAAVAPLGVLLVWGMPPAKSIAFHYHTTLIPVLFLAAITGASRGHGLSACAGQSGDGLRQGVSGRQAARVAIVAGLVGSIYFGDMPWSVWRWHGEGPVAGVVREVDRQRIAALDRAVRLVGEPDSAVLATSRLAAHLIHVERLEVVRDARFRWGMLHEEVGWDRSPIELFDWIAVDLADESQQERSDIRWVLAQARRAGYRQVLSERNVLVLGPPSVPAAEQ